MESKSANIPPAEKTMAVCIRNGVPIREEPRKEGKRISSMNLGETAYYYGQTAIDTAHTPGKYYKLELSDGTLQWVSSSAIIINAKPAAVMTESPVWVRPAHVTKTDKSFKRAEFLVIISEKNEWAEVIGAENRKKGWIQKSALSTKVEDASIAALAQIELLDKNGDIQIDKISGFLKDIPYPDARLAILLQNLLNEQIESAIEESIMEYEEQAISEEEI